MTHEHYSLTKGRNIPISSRESIPDGFYHSGKRLGDIVVGDSGIPLVVWSYTHLDDGSGAGGFIFQDKQYKIVSSIYDKGGVEILLPFLAERGRFLNYEAYGLAC